MKSFRERQLLCFSCLSQILSYDYNLEIHLSLQTPVLAPQPCQRGVGKVYARRVKQDCTITPVGTSLAPQKAEKPCRGVEGSALYHRRTKRTGRWSLSLEGGGVPCVPALDKIQEAAR